MKLLFDHNVSPKVPRAIHELIKADFSEAAALGDKFPPDAADVDWIDQLGREGGWAVVSGDRRITKNKAERAAWLQTDLVGFFMEPSLTALDPWQQTARLIFWLPAIQAQLKLISGPALFTLPLKASSRLKVL
ncbi:hypothetical protein [Devosia sp.]|uniref:PIN-like domain-containing protein n=1 Tax=Devosia sp. TaxID=1871048 RepID=UPI002734A555|nr:hypothetical protein [Devosia sp.]MDP2780818.1 hypothetical protein [Devosia sp.]